MRRRNLSKIIIQISVSLFFAVTIAAPIISMFSRISKDGIEQLTSSSKFVPALINSVTTAFTATVISMILAIAASFALSRTKMRGKGFFAVIFMLPMLVPSISHAYGLKILFGVNGSGILSSVFGSDFSIFGFTGIVAGSVMYSFPVAFLMIHSILQYEDGLPYNAAKVLGIPPFKRFLGITLPYLRKTLISMFFAVFTMIITDYGVPEALYNRDFGYTLSMLMFEDVQGVHYAQAGFIGVLLLIPAVIAFAVDLFVPELSQSGFVTEKVEPGDGKLSKGLSYAICTVISVLVMAPIGAFIVQVFAKSYPIDLSFTLSHIAETFRSGADGFLTNSLIYSVLSAVFGTALAFLCAYLTSRAKGGISRALHLISITSVAIPGLVLGLSYVIFFSKTEIYGTIFIIALANSIHFFASPYLMMYNTLGKVNPNLEDVGKTLGIKKIRIIFDVLVPKVKFTIYEMLVYFFVNSMMTISAVSLLAPPAPKPIAVMISQSVSQMQMEKAAAVSLLILLINFAVKMIMTFINKVKRPAH
ncbi:MAG: ABC transporter permease subunit [Clostridia bacterium]|nr:ABC transporter permease subunit [Clostridia bacterium]